MHHNITQVIYVTETWLSCSADIKITQFGKCVEVDLFGKLKYVVICIRSIPWTTECACFSYLKFTAENEISDFLKSFEIRFTL